MPMNYAAVFNEYYNELERKAKDDAHKARALAAQRFVEPDMLAEAMSKWARTISAAAMVRAQHYYHHGQWRPISGPARNRQHPTSVSLSKSPGDVREYVEITTWKAHAGDPDAYQRLDCMMDSEPFVWDTVDDVNKRTLLCWQRLMSEKSGVGEDALSIRVTIFKAKYLESNPGRAERALIDALAAARMVLTFAENLQEASGREERERRKRLGLANRRVTEIRKALTYVHKALTPAVLPFSPVDAESGTLAGKTVAVL